MRSRENQAAAVMCQKIRKGRLHCCSLSYDYANCMHPIFVGCYVVQAFSIAFDLDPKLMPEEKNQIMMRKVCAIIQSLLPHHPSHHSGYGSDHEKYYTFLTLPWRQNIVYEVTNVEQHKLFGIDASCVLSDVTQKQANLLTVVEVSSTPLPQEGHSGISARPALKAQLRRGSAFRVSRQVSKNSELFKKLESNAQFHWE